MGRNASLDDFGAGGEERRADPIEPVHRWSPDGLACPACGSTVEELWLSDGAAGRCPDCTEW